MPVTRGRWAAKAVAGICAVIALMTGCKPDSIGTPLDDDLVVRQAVAGGVADAIDGSGHFILSTQAASLREISGQVAQAQADGWVKTFASQRLPSLSAARGERILLEGLHSCGRPYRAASAYDLGTETPLPLRRALGDRWLVSLCTATGTPAILVSVSVYNTDVRIENGFLRLPALQGGQFKTYGIPKGMADLLMSPEHAALMAYRATGIRLAAVPELELAPGLTPSYEARWRVVLEHPAQLQGPSGETVTTSEVWIGRPARRAAPTLAAAGLTSPDLVVDAQQPITVGILTRSKPVRLTLLSRKGRAAWMNVTPTSTR